ncbi:MAG: putative motility protein [Alphaproteobacteria bacterium]|nr:putative motility protein [Alphaproteobacteria bacterium]
MAEIGTIGSYMLSVQKMQMSLIKNAIEMQQQVMETLLGDSAAVVPPSEFLGHNVDISI